MVCDFRELENALSRWLFNGFGAPTPLSNGFIAYPLVFVMFNFISRYSAESYESRLSAAGNKGVRENRNTRE
jgi:hypothetical protein